MADAAAASFQIKVDSAQVMELFRRAPEVLTKRLRQLIEGGAIDVQKEMILEAPAGVNQGRGGLRGSIRYTFSVGNLEAEVAPAVPYAPYVEEGTRPHWVSVKPGTPLYEWATKKNINPYALQKSIATKGTKAHPFVKPTYDKTAPKVQRDVEAGMTKLTEELNNGSL